MDGNNPNYRIITICHDLQERRVIDRIININKSVPAGYLVCSSYRIYWQQSCSDLYSSQEYCKYPVLAHSAAITVSLPIRSANQIFQFWFLCGIGSSPVLLWISSRFFSYRKCISIHTDCSSALLQDHVIVTTKIYSVARFANYYCCQNIRKYTLNDTLDTPARTYSNQEYFIPLRNKSVLLP